MNETYLFGNRSAFHLDIMLECNQVVLGHHLGEIIIYYIEDL